MEIITPSTHPDHHAVGRFFDGHKGPWYCDSYDPRCGYWMTSLDGTRRKNVSERAIDRTFHTITKTHNGDGYSRWRNISDDEMKTLIPPIYKGES